MNAAWQALLALALAAPLALALLALVPAMRGRALDLLVPAPLAGLFAAVLVPTGDAMAAPALLLGMSLTLDAQGAVFLGYASFLWLMAGIYARVYLANTARPQVFACFWLLTLFGNLGVFVAGDVATFYVSFAFVSLAAYGLVVHDGSERARRAGRVYIVLAVLGETCLLAALMIGVSAAESILVADVRAALTSGALANVALLLLVAGFGLKAGLVPLHVWLPLAHPAAPTPASAVLSGAIVKAGIFGLMRFLPLEEALPGWSDGLIAAGIATAYYGVLVGVTQSHPKTILAYSTLSQMGLVIAVLGAGLGTEGVGLTLSVASLYALHHGLAKGALFLGVGVAAASGRRALVPVLALVSVMGVAIAGLPLTGGALAKLAIKAPLGAGPAGLLVSLSAIGTSLLMIRFVLVLARSGSTREDAEPPATLVFTLAGTALAALIVPWTLFAPLAGLPLTYGLGLGNLWAGLWPILLAGLIAGLAIRFRPLPLPRIPEGDIVVPVLAAIRDRPRTVRRARAARRSASLLARRSQARAAAAFTRATAGLEAALARWSVAGAVLLAVAIGIGASLVPGY